MKIITVDLNNIAQEQIGLIVDYLKRGQVIAYPTDTVYGLGCDARNAEAVAKIKEIKGRGTRKQESKKTKKQGKKAMLVLVSDYEMLKKYCVVSSEQMKSLEKILAEKAPVTVILENRKNLPVELTGGLNSLAVRLPRSEFLIKIIKQAGFPIVSTSLNKAGEPPLSKAWNLEKYFKYLPDLVIDAGECENAKPSRLVDLRDMENIKVIRK